MIVKAERIKIVKKVRNEGELQSDHNIKYCMCVFLSRKSVQKFKSHSFTLKLIKALQNTSRSGLTKI